MTQEALPVLIHDCAFFPDKSKTVYPDHSKIIYNEVLASNLFFFIDFKELVSFESISRPLQLAYPYSHI